MMKRYELIHYFYGHKTVLFSCYLTDEQLVVAQEWADDMGDFEGGVYVFEEVGEEV